MSSLLLTEVRRLVRQVQAAPHAPNNEDIAKRIRRDTEALVISAAVATSPQGVALQVARQSLQVQ